MNTKGIKFLAVLAVLAMAFAACVVITDANQSSAEVTPAAYYDNQGSSAAKNVSSVSGADNSLDATTVTKFVVTEVETTVTGTVGASKTPTIYLLPATDLTISMTASTWTNVTIITATADENNKITSGGISMTLTAANAIKVASDVKGNVTVEGTEATASAISVPSGVLTLKAGKVIAKGTVNNASEIIFNGGYLVIDGGSLSTSGNIKGLVTVEKTGAGLAENAAIIMKGGDLKNQTIVIKHGTSVAPVKIAYSADLEALTADVNITDNDFYLTNGEHFISTTLPQADSTINVTISKNTFSSIVPADGVVHIGRGSGAIDTDVKFIITNNDFSGIASYGTSSAGKTTVVFGSSGSTIGTSISATDGTNVALSNNTAMGIGFRQNENVIKQSLTVDYLGVQTGQSMEIAAKAVVAVSDTINNAGTINNKGILNITGEIKSLGTITNTGDGKVQYDNKDVTIQPATDAADIKTKVDAAVDAAIITFSAGSTAETAVTVGTKDIALQISTAAVSKLNFTVSTGGALSVTTDAVATYSGVITAGTQKITMNSVKGNFTITPGSIEIDGNISGDIILANGAQLIVKNSLTVDADGATISVAEASHKATVKVPVDAKATLNGDLDIGQGISVIVDGKVDGLDTATLTVAKDMTVNSGAVVSTIAVDGIGDFTVYSGSDINYADFTAVLGQLTGKDSSTGTWTVDGEELILKGYNGTYNFGNIVITTITVSGDNSITYAPASDDAYFMSLFSPISIETLKDYGSLEIEYDVSNISKELISDFNTAVIGTAVLGIDTVDLTVILKGTNSAWKADEITGRGIDAGYIDIDNSHVSVEVLSVYTADWENVVGINATNGFELNASTLTVVSGGTGILANDNATVTIKSASEMTVNGKAYGMYVKGDLTDPAVDMTVSGVSKVTVKNGFWFIGAAAVKQDSLLDVEGLELGDYKLDLSEPGFIKNDGEVRVSGQSTFWCGGIQNGSVVSNSGTISILQGEILNDDGTFTNGGTVNVYTKSIDNGGEITFTPKAGEAIKKDTAEVISIDIEESEMQSNGILKITKALVDFKAATANGAYDVTLNDLQFTGTLTTAQNVVADDMAYRLNLTDGKISISVSFNNAATTKYTMTANGNLIDGTKTFAMIAPTAKDTDSIVTKIADVDLDVDEGVEFNNICVNGGEFVNNGTVSNFGTTTVVLDAEFDGNLVSGINVITIGGEFNGDITTDGGVAIVKLEDLADGKVVGNITAKGMVISNGSIEGNIVSESSVTVADLDGDITVNRESTDDLTIAISGKVEGKITYNSKYKATKDAETKTTYTAVLDIDADMTATTLKTLVINLEKGVDADETTTVKAGYFSFENTDAPATGKSVNITATAGTFAFPASLPVPVGYVMVFEAGSTIEVASVATVDMSNAALKVSKDATSNFVTGTTPVTDYGIVKATMSFTIEGGAYTIYSDVAYALTNCEEGSELTVNDDADINSTVNIPKDVNFIVSDKVTVDFKTFGLTMSDGAKITLKGTAKLVFGETGKAATTEALFTINGKFVYDDNTILIEKVRFTGPSEISGIAATSTALSKFSVDLSYKSGSVALYAGNGEGTISLTNASEAPTKGADKVMTSGKFIISEGTVFNANKIEDDANVKDAKGEEDLKLATDVVIGGTLNLLDNTTVKGVYAGTGTIVLADNKVITLTKATKYGEDPTTGDYSFYGATITATINDKASTANSIGFIAVYAGTENDFAITAFKDSTKQYLLMSGYVEYGSITTLGETTVAKLQTLVVKENAAITANATEVLLGNIGGDYDGFSVVAEGTLITKTIKMDKAGEYGKLKYNSTYAVGDYTAYTAFKNIDFDYVSDVTISESTDVSKLIKSGSKLDLSGKDVNITLAKDVILTVDKVMIIGTPATTLGDEGSSIVGKVIINIDSYIIAYADVDLSEAEIVGAANKDAVTSRLDVEETMYAAIIGCDDNVIPLAKADKTIVPEIVGFNFTAWINYSGNVEACIGDTNAYADAKAVLCTVMVKYVAGVDYYMNGVLFNVYDIPTDVSFGSYFTAKISDTTKYQGNPLINGLKTVYVDDDMVLEASGVTPIPEPAPEPVEENTGLSLTDILLIVLVILIAIMVVILVLRLNRS